MEHGGAWQHRHHSGDKYRVQQTLKTMVQRERRCWEKEKEGETRRARRALNLFSRFAIISDALRCSEIYLLRVPFISSMFFPLEIVII